MYQSFIFLVDSVSSMQQLFSTPQRPELSIPFSSTIRNISSFFENFICAYNEICSSAPISLPQHPYIISSIQISSFMFPFCDNPLSPFVAPVTQAGGYCIPGGLHLWTTMGKAGAAHIPCTRYPQTLLGTTWTVATSAFIMQVLDSDVLS